ncbi:SPOR domain-containing protein [Thauera sinica]|uniref:SPOR domain-containing protein n=1 Tax=Thauera sinica TaxID=2665146 RepID=A0ABW1AT84_9RHOO|nr:SPOR domain-containing protein [Thauera sp. K11]ATE62742.1 cell division protein FtsN [Thauera sp. K11]
MSRDRKPARKSARPPARSGGGTLMGIFIGLILGALIAAGAAWYFTRANPFQAAPGAPPRASVADQPPAALPGKPGDRPVVKQDFEFYKILPQGDGTTSEQQPAPARTAPERAAEKPSDKAVAPVKEAQPKPVERLYLQIGSFENPAEADNLKARLALAGIEASGQRVQLADGRTVHRVRIGPFSSPEEMNPARARLAEAGFSATISRAGNPQ